MFINCERIDNITFLNEIYQSSTCILKCCEEDYAMVVGNCTPVPDAKMNIPLCIHFLNKSSVDIGRVLIEEKISILSNGSALVELSHIK